MVKPLRLMRLRRASDEDLEGPTYLGIGSMQPVSAIEGSDDSAPSLWLKTGSGWEEHVLLPIEREPGPLGFQPPDEN